MRYFHAATIGSALWFACASGPAPAAQKNSDVEVRAFVNDTCIVADEPYFKPAVAGETNERSVVLLSLVVGKLTQLIVQHALSSSAQKLTSNAARQDTVYAMTRATNLYVATLDPAPNLSLNGAIGCMTIVAGKFRTATVDCTADYLPRTLDPDTAAKPEADWRTARSDDSVQNQLRRANICTDGEPRAMFESRFEFSDDGTAYRLTDAGYRIQSLMGTSDTSAERHVFYTLDINEPGMNDTPEHLSTAWIDLGRVMAGQRSGARPEHSTPWLRVPPLSVEARRTYETRTRVQQDTYAQIEALRRAIVRQQRIDAALSQRIDGASAAVAAGLRDQLVHGQVLIESLNAELAARKAEYAELPREPLALMPVSIQVGVTESRSEKKALLALAKIIDSNSGSLASAASGMVSRSIDVVSGAEIARALAEKPKTRGIALRGKTEAREMIDLNIPFELDSSDLRPDAIAQLAQLEAALDTEALAAFRFRITGHTDASGTVEHNRALSLQRAQAVQRFLAAHGVDAARLDIAGAGADQLLRPDAPRDAANRRVEVRNLGKVQP